LEDETNELYYKYSRAIEDHNLYVDSYNWSVRSSFEQLYQHMQKQEDLMKDNLVKFMIF